MVIKIVRDLLKHGPYNSYEWRVPRALFSEKEEIRAAWAQAFFDGEAYFEMTWNKRAGSWIRRVIVGSVNRKGLADVKELLKNFED